MVKTTEALRREALALPDPERADLAAELLASLDKPAADDPETVSALWSEELHRRGERALSREAVGEDWDSLRRRLADELSG
jgi:Putative addiction module component